MRRVVVSVNNNPDFFYYLPLCYWAWNKMGWNVEIFYNRDYKIPIDSKALEQLMLDTIGQLHQPESLKSIEGYRSDTITQVSRLYGACLFDNGDYLMTIDVDMLPLSNYWQPNEEEITIWGFDLTGYTEIPMCYVGMKASRWREVFGLTNDDYNALIKRDLDSMPQAKEDQPWEKRWSVDQQLLTKRLNETTFKKTFITRGQLPNGYARGRVDRGSWSLEHPELIDAHLLRDCYKDSEVGRQNLVKVLQLLNKVWPDENFDWVVKYTHEFRKLANNG